MCCRHYSAVVVGRENHICCRTLGLVLDLCPANILPSLIPTSFPLQIFQLEKFKFSRAFSLGLLEVPSSQKSDFLTSLQGSGFGCIPGCTGGSGRDSICPVSLADGHSPCSRCVQPQHLSWTGFLVRVPCSSFSNLAHLSLNFCLIVTTIFTKSPPPCVDSGTWLSPGAVCFHSWEC